MIPMGVDFLEVLKDICNKKPAQLEEDEKAFLKARRYYLTTGQLNKFSSILDPEVVIPDEPKPKIKRKAEKVSELI